MSEETPTSLAFPRDKRLKTPGEFRRVQTEGRSFDLGPLVVRVAKRVAAGGEPPAKGRLGLAVSRRAGNSVQRNRVKRLVRETFRRHVADFDGLDLVVTARPGACDQGLADVQKLFDELLRRLRAGRR